jgi:uncharacterized membrane protein HdeD (DUF308 family)
VNLFLFLERVEDDLSGKPSIWYRILQIFLGIVSIILAVAVWAYFSVSVIFVIFLFTFALITTGLSGIVSGASGRTLIPMRRILEFVLGVILIVVAILVVLFPSLGISFLIVLLGIGLLLNGIIDIVSGAANASLQSWQRYLYIIFGVVLLIFSIVILINPTLGTILWITVVDGILLVPGTFLPSFGFYYIIPSFGYLLLVALLSVGLIIRGIHAIISGSVGTE